MPKASECVTPALPWPIFQHRPGKSADDMSTLFCIVLGFAIPNIFSVFKNMVVLGVHCDIYKFLYHT
jgi:hypothetical protein